MWKRWRREKTNLRQTEEDDEKENEAPDKERTRTDVHPNPRGQREEREDRMTQGQRGQEVSSHIGSVEQRWQLLQFN